MAMAMVVGVEDRINGEEDDGLLSLDALLNSWLMAATSLTLDVDRAVHPGSTTASFQSSENSESEMVMTGIAYILEVVFIG